MVTIIYTGRTVVLVQAVRSCVLFSYAHNSFPLHCHPLWWRSLRTIQYLPLDDAEARNRILRLLYASVTPVSMVYYPCGEAVASPHIPRQGWEIALWPLAVFSYVQSIGKLLTMECQTKTLTKDIVYMWY